MLDELFDLFDRKKRHGGHSPRGIGGLLDRVQHTMERDDDHGYRRRYDHDDDRRYRGQGYGRDHDDEDHGGRHHSRRRSRDAFDVD
jgi:hypothetical protein